MIDVAGLSYWNDNQAGYSWWSSPPDQYKAWGLPEDIYLKLKQQYDSHGIPVVGWEPDNNFLIDFKPPYGNGPVCATLRFGGFFFSPFAVHGRCAPSMLHSVATQTRPCLPIVQLASVPRTNDAVCDGATC